jgi:hypothetical protein
MHRKDTSRWLTVFAAIACGGAIGFVCAGALCKGFLHWQQSDTSDVDTFRGVVLTIIGVIVISILLPLAIWFFIRKKTDKNSNRPGY